MWTNTSVSKEGDAATHGATGNSPRPSASEDCLGGSGLAWAGGDPAHPVVLFVMNINTLLCTRDGCSLEKTCCVFGERVVLFHFIYSQKRRS